MTVEIDPARQKKTKKLTFTEPLKRTVSHWLTRSRGKTRPSRNVSTRTRSIRMKTKTHENSSKRLEYNPTRTRIKEKFSSLLRNLHFVLLLRCTLHCHLPIHTTKCRQLRPIGNRPLYRRQVVFIELKRNENVTSKNPIVRHDKRLKQLIIIFRGNSQRLGSVPAIWESSYYERLHIYKCSSNFTFGSHFVEKALNDSIISSTNPTGNS